MQSRVASAASVRRFQSSTRACTAVGLLAWNLSKAGFRPSPRRSHAVPMIRRCGLVASATCDRSARRSSYALTLRVAAELVGVRAASTSDIRSWGKASAGRCFGRGDTCRTSPLKNSTSSKRVERQGIREARYSRGGRCSPCLVETQHLGCSRRDCCAARWSTCGRDTDTDRGRSRS